MCGCVCVCGPARPPHMAPQGAGSEWSWGCGGGAAPARHRGVAAPDARQAPGARLPAGAFGCTISGAGPTAVAIVSDPEVGQRVKEAMVGAFKAAGGLEVNSAKVVRLDNEGAKRV